MTASLTADVLESGLLRSGDRLFIEILPISINRPHIVANCSWCCWYVDFPFSSSSSPWDSIRALDHSRSSRESQRFVVLSSSWSMSSSTYSNDCKDQGFDPSLNRFSDEWPRWPVVSVSPSLLSEDSLPSISSLSQGLRIQNALQVLLRSQSVIYQVLNSHWYCFGRILWSIVVTFNTPSWSIWYLAASLDPSGLPWVRYSNFCDNFKI